MTSPIALKSRGFYKLEVLREGTVTRRMSTDNVVTYVGAYKSFFGTAMFGDLYIAVGTGTTEIVRGNTTLNSHLKRGSGAGADRLEVDNSDGTSTITCKRVLSFPLGAVVGTISEVGLYDRSSGGDLIAGQLIKDEFGDPTTLTLLADEQLKVTYTIEYTVPNASQSVAPMISSGTVTTPRGSHTFEMYAQPFFCEYTVPSADKNIRANRARQYVVLNRSNGTMLRTAFGGGKAISKSHDGSGTVVVTSPSLTVAPTTFNSADIKFMSIGGASNAHYDLNYNIDTTSKRVLSADTTYVLAVIEFTPAVEKKDTESFAFQFNITYTV